MPFSPGNRMLGWLLGLTTVLVVFDEWSVAAWSAPAKPVFTLALIAAYAVTVRPGRRAFIIFAAALTAVLVALDPNWFATVLRALDTTAFIAAFFSALTILKSVAETSPAIQSAGRFLAGQPPGRRYLALTLGGQAFTLLLNYGALQLLGAMAVTSARTEPNPEIRAIRMRRMLLAVERGLASTIPWSPLSFGVAISTAVVPGASWLMILLPSFVTGLIMASVGWALDTLVRQRVSAGTVVQPPKPEGGWTSLAPLGVLLVILVVSVSAGHATTGVRVAGLVTVIVPLMALGWLLIQEGPENRLARTGGRLRRYLFEELPAFSGEMSLLMMAGYIGTVGAQVLTPVLARLGVDLTVLPLWLLLVSFVWIIPLLGQFAMNPILAVTLIAPLIPAPEALGVSPAVIAVALTAGWAISAASSPFTATQLLLAHYAGVSAWHVGFRWNGLYTLVCLVLLSGWVLVNAFLF